MIKARRGFTIVELLIVIVVIGILAAITAVAYNGIQNRGYDTSIQSDLKSLLTYVELYNADNGKYPVNADQILGYKVNKNAYAVSTTTTYNVTACFVTGGATFAATALSKSGKIFYFTAPGNIKEYSGSWSSTNSGAACTAIMATTTANYNGYSSVDTTTGPWRSWVGGN